MLHDAAVNCDELKENGQVSTSGVLDTKYGRPPLSLSAPLDDPEETVAVTVSTLRLRLREANNCPGLIKWDAPFNLRTQQILFAHWLRLLAVQWTGINESLPKPFAAAGSSDDIAEINRFKEVWRFYRRQTEQWSRLIGDAGAAWVDKKLSTTSVQRNWPDFKAGLEKMAAGLTVDDKMDKLNQDLRDATKAVREAKEQIDELKALKARQPSYDELEMERLKCYVRAALPPPALTAALLAPTPTKAEESLAKKLEGKLEAAAVKALELEAENKALTAKNTRLQNDLDDCITLKARTNGDPAKTIDNLEKMLATEKKEKLSLTARISGLEARNKELEEQKPKTPTQKMLTDEDWQKQLNEERTKRLKAEADCKAQKAALEAQVAELRAQVEDLEGVPSLETLTKEKERLESDKAVTEAKNLQLLKENAKLKAEQTLCNSLKDALGTRDENQLKKLLEKADLEDRMQQAVLKADKLETEAKVYKARITALQNQVVTATQNQEAAIRDKKAAELDMERANVRADVFRAEIKALESGGGGAAKRMLDLTEKLAAAEGRVVIAEAKSVALEAALDDQNGVTAQATDRLEQCQAQVLTLEAVNKELQQNIIKCTFELAREQAMQQGQQQQPPSQPQPQQQVQQPVVDEECLRNAIKLALPAPSLTNALAKVEELLVALDTKESTIKQLSQKPAPPPQTQEQTGSFDLLPLVTEKDERDTQISGLKAEKESLTQTLESYQKAFEDLTTAASDTNVVDNKKWDAIKVQDDAQERESLFETVKRQHQDKAQGLFRLVTFVSNLRAYLDNTTDGVLTLTANDELTRLGADENTAAIVTLVTSSKAPPATLACEEQLKKYNLYLAALRSVVNDGLVTESSWESAYPTGKNKQLAEIVAKKVVELTSIARVANALKKDSVLATLQIMDRALP